MRSVSAVDSLVIPLPRRLARRFPRLARQAKKIPGVIRVMTSVADMGSPVVFLRRRLARRFPRLARHAREVLGLAGALEQALTIFPQKPMEASRLDRGRETLLLVVHDGSRTGAPILAYNIAKRLARQRNVVALFLGGGELIEDFRGCCAAVVGPLGPRPPDPAEAEDLVQRLVRTYPIAYAIVNTIASRVLLRPLALADVPTLALVHEFGSYMLVREEMGPALEWATQIVFSAELTAASARADYPSLDNKPVHVLRQGRPDLPMRDQVALAEEARVIRKAVRPEGSASAFVVFGCGTIMLRKGVDLFLSCASAVASLKPQRPVRFAWIGSPVDPAYQIFLDEQVARAGLGDMVALLDEVADLGPAYELADLFFMCSRLDPLPNVAIDAALRGLPVVCFDKATGIAEALREDPVAGSSVVPYVDVQAAARLIADLADDPVAYAKISEATRRVAERVFDMDDYVRRLDGLGHEAMALIRQRKADFATISADSLFDFDLSAGRDGALRTRDEAIWHFLVSSGAAGVGRHQPDNVHYRRPCPGFHPKIYEQENIAGADRGRVNVLAHFIRSGKPVGSWSHEIITPDDNPDDPGELRVAVHGHFHYPELAPEFMRRLTANRLRCDLLLSTDSESKAAVMSRAVEGYDRGRVAIRVGRNRGRDIGPLLTLFGPAALAPYDIIGHFHGKRSLVLGDQTVGETWREFLWQNLLGGLHPMADVIVARLRQDQRLGLVFPEDPHLCGWDANYEIATDQARRLGLALPLPPFFDFPVGTMFWARTAALKPLFDLELGWDDYPAEPVPYDGTVLHAIERLLPFVARHAGYRFATTHIPGVAR